VRRPSWPEVRARDRVAILSLTRRIADRLLRIMPRSSPSTNHNSRMRRCICPGASGGADLHFATRWARLLPKRMPVLISTPRVPMVLQAFSIPARSKPFTRSRRAAMVFTLRDDRAPKGVPCRTTVSSGPCIPFGAGGPIAPDFVAAPSSHECAWHRQGSQSPVARPSCCCAVQCATTMSRHRGSR